MLRNRRLRWLLGLAAALALVATACGDDSAVGDDDGAGEAAAPPTCLDLAALYALTGPESVGVANWSDAAALADEVGSAHGAELPDAPLTITGPGEESGTYDTFVEFVVETFAEDRQLGDDEIALRPDYTASADDNVILEGVAGTDGSLGWVGFAFAEEAGDAVREIEIAGEDGTCIAPTTDTIADGSYPLSRPLFIYVSTTSAEENPAVQAFVDVFTGDPGYQAVTDAGYVQLEDVAWGEAQAAWEAAGGSPGEPAAGVAGDVVVSGSSTVQPITSLVAEQFSADNPDVSISVDGPGTGDGFELFCNGETDIADASRPIEDDEVAACEDNGVEFVELQIGIDGLSVLTRA